MKDLFYPQGTVHEDDELKAGAVEAAGRLTAIVRRQRDEYIHASSAFTLSSPYTIQDLQPREWFYPRWSFFLLQLM